MNLQTFRGRDLADAFAQARHAFGDDAMILRTEVERDGRTSTYLVTATSGEQVERFRARVAPQPLRAARGRRPLVLALVGPTGAGKTTSAVKLALHASAFGERRVGLITLDTYRAGAVEQLGVFAEVAELPLEVVYQAGELEGAMRRLHRCEVILIDTPGRRPKSAEMTAELRAMLDAAAPDETHLVLPATLRLDLVPGLREAFSPLCPTHLLVTKLDEVPGEVGLAELVSEVDLPVRWVGDGQEIPDDVRPAGGRVLASLGAAHAQHAARGAA